MAKFLTTRQVSAELETIINNAKDWLFLISPYLDVPGTLLECIKSADNKKVKIMLIYGKKEKQEEALSELSRLKNISVRYSEHLHSKCYFNEASMIITSMNLYAYSEANNREMGILITKTGDSEIFNDAYQEVTRILENSNEVSIKGSPRVDHQQASLEVSKQNQPRGANKGFCIRCGTNIAYNPIQPYCSSCYKVWSKWNNPEYQENACHRCGRQAATSKNSPVCGYCNLNSFADVIKGLFRS